MIQSQFYLLKTKRFLPLFITQFLGAFNDNVFKNALVILMTYKVFANSHLNIQILVTVAAGLFILPFFLFSATAGQLADKIEKSYLIRIIKFAEIILMILATLGFYFNNISMLMTILFLLGSQATFFGPIKYAILPIQLHPDELIAGNGLIEAGTFLSILLGTIFGGVIILLPHGEYYISIALLLFSLIGFLSSLYIPNTHVENTEIIICYNFLRETFRVIQYSKARRDLYLSILGISWFWLVGAVFLAEFPVFTKDILHANEHIVTWFIAIFSIGIGIGSLLCNRLLNGKVHTTYVPIGAIGITVFGIDLYFAARHNMLPSMHLMGMIPFLQSFTGWRVSFDLLLISICGGLYTVPLYAILQQRSDPMYRSRVIASNNILNAFFMVISAIGTIVMLKLHFTVNDVFLTVAILNAFVAMYICQ